MFQQKNQNNVDAETFLLFIINKLHEELGSHFDNNNKEIGSLQQELNSQNEQKMLNDFLNL